MLEVDDKDDMMNPSGNFVCWCILLIFYFRFYVSVCLFRVWVVSS